MKIKIEDKQENPLLKRQDITFLVDHTGAATPTRLDVRAKLSAMLNCKEDQLYITKLNGLFGQSTSQGYAHLYPSKEAAQVQEQNHIIKRHAIEEVAPPTPKEPVEAAPEEKIEEAKEPLKEEAEKPPKKEEKKEEAKEAPEKEEPKAATKKEGKPKKGKAEKAPEKKEAS